VAAVAQQVVGRRVEPREQVEARDAAPEPVPVSPSSAMSTAGRW
jgi:hypothetical protein